MSTSRYRPTYGLWLWFITDGVLWVLAQWFGLYLRFEGIIPGIEYEYFFRFVPLSTAGLLGAYLYMGVYRRDLGDDWRWRTLWWGWISAVSIALAVLFFLKIPYSRAAFLVGAFVFFAMNVGSRALIQVGGNYLGTGSDRVLLVGFSEGSINREVRSKLGPNYEIIEDLDFDDASFRELQGVGADLIIVNGTNFDGSALEKLYEFGSRRQIPVRIYPDSDQLFLSEMSQVSWRDVRLLRSNFHYRLQQQMAVKTVFDYVVGSLLLVLFLPVILFVSLLIYLIEGRPIFYAQERTGRSGDRFTLYKFRTMVPDADQVGPNLTEGPDDPRITTLGRFLRRWSLDELPQLFNVVRGEMSLVGPRPEIPSITSDYEPEQRRILWLKPGLTGLSQVSGRQELELQEKLNIDQQYLMDYSVGLDLWILLKTLWAVVRGRGAS